MSLDQTRELTRTTFAQLSRDRPELTDLDRRIMAAFERLLDGRPPWSCTCDQALHAAPDT